MTLTYYGLRRSVFLLKPLLSANPNFGEERCSFSLGQGERPRNSPVSLGPFSVALVLPVERCPTRTYKIVLNQTTREICKNYNVHRGIDI